MTLVHWVVDTFLTDHRSLPTGMPTLAEAIAEAGHPLHKTSFDPNHPDLTVPFPDEACVVAYGSHQFIRQLEHTYRARCWSPSSFHRVEQLTYSAVSARLGSLMLNDDYVILPFGEVVRRRPAAFGGEIFLKPNAVTKPFAGLVVDEASFDHEVNALKQLARPEDDLLCVVAKPKPMEGEYRFVVADRQVVSGSQYLWRGRLDVRIDVPPVCEALAWEIAGHPWQPDLAYVVDIAWVEDRTAARGVELNPFSTSGLYALDTRKIVDAISRCSLKAFQEGI